jgi:hypothetical protein
MEADAVHQEAGKSLVTVTGEDFLNETFMLKENTKGGWQKKSFVLKRTICHFRQVVFHSGKLFFIPTNS